MGTGRPWLERDHITLPWLGFNSPPSPDFTNKNMGLIRSKKLKSLLDDLASKDSNSRKKLMKDPKFCRELQKALEGELGSK
jgi:hypothetical protein